MPPEPRPIPRFAAEPPHESLPYGRWAEALGERFLAACAEVDAGHEEHGEPGEIAWYPDRTYAGRTYLPAATETSTGAELFGFVSYRRAREGAEPADFRAFADATTETAARNPDWELDLSDHELEGWRGPEGRR
ncbi:MAG TPA: hypothetical protein VK387_05535, partial [Thermoleophilaceae bacterium]|nr:hypothetical protein [Thermoleophilaceae bacterium]